MYTNKLSVFQFQYDYKCIQTKCISVSSHFISRITGTVLVEDDASEKARKNADANDTTASDNWVTKHNIGLNLKFRCFAFSFCVTDDSCGFS